MISRLRRESFLVAALFGLALLTVACQKVPLLAPSGSTIQLTALATALPVNGSTDLIAQVIEAGGTPPHSGTLVTFTTNLGSVQPSQAETDISGRVTVRFLAGTGSGTATITALSGGVSASGTNAIKIAVGAAAVGGIALSANPTTLPASGGTTTIVAAVNDSGGNPLPSVPVTFTTDNGSLGTSVVTSDTNGRAQTTLTTSRTAKVTATAGVATTSGTTTTAASTNSITVTVNAAATVSLTGFSPSPAAAGQPVSFTLTVTPSTTGAAIQNVVVNFGDGRSQTLGAVTGATTLSHIYDSPGTYSLNATVTDSNGDQFVGVATLSVGPRPRPSITVTAPDNATPGTSTKITLTATPSTVSNAAIQSIAVDFGDGQQQTLQGNASSVQHVYLTAATYTITAIATDANGATGSGSTVIVVGGTAPTAEFTMSPEPSGVGQNVTFNGSDSVDSATITSYDWDFGDGSSVVTTTSPVTNHVYLAAGTFTARLTIHDSAGRAATKSHPHTVTALAAATADFTMSPEPSKAGGNVSFNGSDSVDSATITSYDWDFGDGSSVVTTTSPTTNHTYATAGTFTARLTIHDSAGRSATKSKSHTVNP